MEARTHFEVFWLATGEQPFKTAVAGQAEVYRLSVRTERGNNHRVYRMQRPSVESAAGSEFVAHDFVFAEDHAASARTYRIAPIEQHWSAMAALLIVADFWDLPEQIGRCGLDGSTYSIEAFRAGRRHRVERWSPNPVVSGGELVCVVTDYLERLGCLAAYQCELHKRYG